MTEVRERADPGIAPGWDDALASVARPTALPTQRSADRSPQPFLVQPLRLPRALGPDACVWLAALLLRYAGATDTAGVLVAYVDRDRMLHPVVITADPAPTPAALRDHVSTALHDRRLGVALADAAHLLRPEEAPLQVCVVEHGDATQVSRLLADSPGGCELAVLVEAGGAAAWLLGRATCFSADALADVARHLECLAAAGEQQPHRPVGELPLAPAGQPWGAVLRGPEREVPAVTLPGLVDEWVRRTPDALAVRAGVGRGGNGAGDPATGLTYGQLGARSRALAARLVSAGVLPGDRVALCLGPTPDLLVAVLAVQRCGAAYVPVEPGYPAERVRFLLDDCAARLVVTDHASWPAQVEASTRRLLYLDGADGADGAAASHGGPVAALPEVPPDAAAYVIYTSGSTGRPKGVVVEHASVVNLLADMAQRPGLAAGEVMVGVTTYAFDLSVPDLFLPLVTGATLVLADRATAADPRALAALLDDAGADLMQATPSTWAMLVDSGWRGRPTMRVVVGGEACPAALARALLARVSQVWNFYGPTEATVWVSAERLADPRDPLPIGQPLRNTTLLVVDRGLRPVPPGVPGELLVGGRGLARGYLGRPELTADRFVTGPLGGGGGEGGDSGGRAYRTGDLVRLTRAGDLEFLGRLDHQVKVRGFRIELGEVEAALREDPGVREAVVVVREDDPGDQRLVGYVVGRPGSPVTPGALRSRLRSRLPAHMVPSAVVLLGRLPMTPNGKLDRSALPAPPTDRAADRPVEPPADDLERRLAGVWSAVLGIEPVSVTDDFFELGVSSLLVARLLARVEQELDCRLPAATPYAAPSVRALAALLRDDGHATPQHSALVPIAVTGSRRPAFLVHGGAGTVLFYRGLATRLAAAGVPVYALQAVGLYGQEAPLREVSEMAARYVAELRTVQPQGPYRLVGYCFGGLVVLEMAHQLEQAGDQVELAVMVNATTPWYDERHSAEFRSDGTTSRPPPAPREVARSRWQSSRGRSAPARAVDLAAAGGRRLRVVVRRGAPRRMRRLRVAWALAWQRPLAPDLREANQFQRLSLLATRRFRPPQVTCPVLVVRAAGLYHVDDLGWSRYTTGEVSSVEVPGFQVVPRDTLREPHVALVAEQLLARLAEEADSAVASGPA